MLRYYFKGVTLVMYSNEGWDRDKREEERIIELYVLLDDGIKPNQINFLLDVICSLIRFHIDFIRNYRVMLKL